MKRIVTSREVAADYRQSQMFPEIHPEDLSTPDARRSRPVSSEEFQSLAAEGKKRYDTLKSQSVGTSGLDNNWDNLVNHSYEQTRQPWGGATINAQTGTPLVGNEDAYALTARDPGKQSVSVSPNASKEEFGAAMGQARQQFAPELSRPGHHLGVFRDEDKGTIDFDPSYVTKDPSDVETIGAYTHNVGGAYHFKSGDGYWPPHVPSSQKVSKVNLEDYRDEKGRVDWTRYKEDSANEEDN